jgi:hypothetical protein
VGREREWERDKNAKKKQDRQKETKHAHHDETWFLGKGKILRSEAMHSILIVLDFGRRWSLHVFRRSLVFWFPFLFLIT